MNKEELEKEARFRTKGWKEQENCVQAYLAGAKPREKQIQIDAEQIRALQKDKGELTDKVKELKAQIEKMKCGGNCKHEYWKNTGGCYDQKCRFTGLDCTNCKDKWKGKWEND